MHSILAVDDSASMRQMVSFTLKNAGFNVVEAVDGQDAWEKASTRDFSLVLTDQNMPRMDGISLTKRLRENPKFKATPILILTTESSDQMKQAGRAAADADADARNAASRPLRKNAAQMAADMRRRGAYSVTL